MKVKKLSLRIKEMDILIEDSWIDLGLGLRMLDG